MLFSGVRVGPSPISGDGLFADTSFKRGGLITVYQGEVCTEERGAVSVFVFKPRGGPAIDGSKGSIAARINSSAHPNAELRDSGGIWAKRPIKIDEEITIAYGKPYWSVHPKLPSSRPTAEPQKKKPRVQFGNDQVRTFHTDTVPQHAACCPNGHGKLRYDVFEPFDDVKTITCDGCYATISPEQFLFGCTKCEIDLCEACGDPDGRSTRRRQRATEPTTAANRPQSPGVQ